MLFDCSASYWPDASADEYLVYTWSLDKVGTAAGSTTLAQALDPVHGTLSHGVRVIGWRPGLVFNIARTDQLPRHRRLQIARGPPDGPAVVLHKRELIPK